jgi:hypothetical protein
MYLLRIIVRRNAMSDLKSNFVELTEDESIYLMDLLNLQKLTLKVNCVNYSKDNKELLDFIEALHAKLENALN